MTSDARGRTLSLETARKYVSRVWFAGSLLIVLILIGQSLGGAYGAHVRTVWAWAVPHFFPTCSLMIGVFASNVIVRKGTPRPPRVRAYFVGIVTGLSALHLLLVLGMLLAQPILPTLQGEDYDLLEQFELSDLWLGLTQAMATVAIGALFFKPEEAAKP